MILDCKMQAGFRLVTWTCQSPVTMVGHGTGANMVSLLLNSPVTQASDGLFQRAILMSGTALSPGAVARDPREITLQVNIVWNGYFSCNDIGLYGNLQFCLDFE